MPDSKDTGEKPWPPVWHFRHKDDGRAAGYTSEPSLARSNIFYDAEKYLPVQVIRERLLSGEAVQAGAYAEFHWLNPTAPNTQESAEERESYLEPFKAGLEAALDAAFSKEEGSDG